MSTPTPFLLDERNRPFVQGQTARPPNTTSGLANGCLPLFLIPFVLAGLFVLIYTGYAWITWSRFLSDARPATAVVTAKEINRGRKSTSYNIVYRYTTSDKHTFEGHSSVGRDRYNSLDKGEKIAVEYLGNSQGTSRLAGENHILMPLFMAFFSLIWNSVIGSVFYFQVLSLRKARRLRIEGQLCPAEIISFSTDRDKNNNLRVTVEYRLIDPNGHTILGQDRNIRNELKGMPAPFCPISAAALYIDEKTHGLL